MRVLITGATGFARGITPIERGYLATAGLVPPFAIQLVLSGTGPIDEDLLRRAAAVAADTCPGARLVRRGRRWIDSGTAPPVTAVACSVALDEVLRRPLDIVRGPSCEIVLLYGERTTVVFRAAHATMDARGALGWAGDVFRALRGETPLGAMSPMADHGLRHRLGVAAGRLRTPLRWPSPLDVAASERGYGWLRRTLPGRHHALVARLASGVAASTDRTARVMIPVDLRRHAPAVASTANLTLPVFLEVTPGRPWTETHVALLSALAADRELRSSTAEGFARYLPTAALRVGIDLTERLTRRLDRYPATAIVSHLGRVDLSDFTTSSFTAGTLYAMPVHAPVAPISFAVTELPAHTEVTMSYQAGAGAEQAATALLRAVLAAAAESDNAESDNAGRDGIGRDGIGSDDADSDNAGSDGIGSDDIGPPAGGSEGDGDLHSAVGPAVHETVVDLLDRQVRQTPDATALICPTGDLTYAELDRHSELVAECLRRAGVEPGDVVGVLAERSALAISAIWGILKAGAAYLPLDSSFPDNRLHLLLADAQAAVCLADRELAHRIRTCPALTIQDLTADGSPTPSVRPGLTGRAYVIYTSGSTGQPKGVEIEHRSLAAYAAWALPRYGVTSATHFALFTSMAFDLSATTIFLPLLAGGSLTLIPGVLTAPKLQAALDGGVNALKLTPTHLDLIVGFGPATGGLDLLVVGGEQLPGPLAMRAKRLFGEACTIVNEYGPTEATVGCVIHTFDPRSDDPAQAVPIGRPTPGTSVVLVAADRRPVPPGAIGEVHLIGTQLARGYLNRPELTAARFVRLRGERAYRTGDLARRRPDGLLEYLGRADEQLKIRGHRVEPAEVVHALEGHAAVARAVVFAGGHQSTAQLYAFVLPQAPVTEADLRSHLAATLPPYLVPAKVTVIEQLPTTASGKLDTHALLEAAAGTRAPTPPEPSTDPVTAAIARTWTDILGVPVDGNNLAADFHQLGGDSVSMLRMLHQIADLNPIAGQRLLANADAVVATPTLATVRRLLSQATSTEAVAPGTGLDPRSTRPWSRGRRRWWSSHPS